MKKEKEKNEIPVGLGIALLLTIIILGIGYLAFTVVVDDIGTSGTEPMNVSMSAGNTVFSIGGTLLVIVAIMVIVGLIYYYVSTPQRYKKVSKIREFFDITTYYFGWGLLCFVIIAVPGYLLWLLSQYIVTTGGTGAVFEVFKWIGLLILAYFALAGFGYVMKKKIVDNWRKRRQERREENIGEGLDKTLG